MSTDGTAPVAAHAEWLSSKPMLQTAALSVCYRTLMLAQQTLCFGGCANADRRGGLTWTTSVWPVAPVQTA
eukprot:CAMPEP_0177707148 /NCGR_PEP_ID=MMETSP0484_2-20121128/9597_1 /TAXON_ID=354590 /ORGANISM="Rhodomonas lens, Strain RHODO" /LENGTH=70 /DNA_ID=CAMNT_0019218643 /DNA_START=30 /DNA_END=238 /DNA_ORIENTATION=+